MGVLGFWGFGVLGFWGFGVLGFWGFGVLGFGFWGLVEFGVLRVLRCGGSGFRVYGSGPIISAGTLKPLNPRNSPKM